MKKFIQFIKDQFPLKKGLSPAQIKKYLYIGSICLFATIFLVCAGFLVDFFVQSAKQKSQYDELANLVQQGQQGLLGDELDDPNGSENLGDLIKPPSTPFTTVINPETGESMEVLTEYAPIYNLNSDVIGWIQIEGTKINYPVLQTPNWVNYYLKRDFNGEASRYGTIYANETADINLPSDNITIYGHRMRDGTMFASLHDYKKQSFYKDHRYITFDTLFEHHKYEIFAIFVDTANTPTSFDYHLFVDGDMQQFNEYVTKCKEMSLYDTGVEVFYGDKLITLSTCEHSIDDGRLVVVAKQIS